MVSSVDHSSAGGEGQRDGQIWPVWAACKGGQGFRELRFFQTKFQSQKNIDLLQVRSNKAEEEVAELMKKSTQLESELDKTKEELVWSCNYEKKQWIFVFLKVMTTQKLEDKEKALLAAELEVSTLNR